MFTRFRRLFEDARLLPGLAHAQAEIAAAVARLQSEQLQRQVAAEQTTQALLAEVAALRASLLALGGQIEALARIPVSSAQVFPSDRWTPEAAARIRGILALLSPHNAAGMQKCRLGRDFDGGYVMLEDFSGIGGALSLGIADDVSWDSAVAARGIDVWQFDPTVAAPPVADQRFHFAALRVAGSDGEGRVSLAGIVQNFVRDTAEPLLLKIDIEGDEWEVFAATPAEILGRFKQIVCEFHHLDRLAEQEFGERVRAVFARLVQTHFVVHVHGNNCGSLVNIGNVVLPETLEVTFAHRGAYQPVASAAQFPTGLDQPNQPGRADLYLGGFTF